MLDFISHRFEPVYVAGARNRLCLADIRGHNECLDHFIFGAGFEKHVFSKKKEKT